MMIEVVMKIIGGGCVMQVVVIVNENDGGD